MKSQSKLLSVHQTSQLKQTLLLPRLHFSQLLAFSGSLLPATIVSFSTPRVLRRRVDAVLCVPQVWVFHREVLL